MKKRILIFALLAAALCLMSAAAFAADTIEGYANLVLQINLPTELPASGGFYSKGCEYYTSFEPTSTRTWTVTPEDEEAPALQITPFGSGKDSKRAHLNLIPGEVYSAGGPYRYTIRNTLNTHEVSTGITVFFVDDLPAGDYSITSAKVLSSSSTETPVPVSGGVMEMRKGETYVLTENVPTNNCFNGFLMSNPDDFNSEWEESYDYPDVNPSWQQVYTARRNGSYSHSFTASYYAMYQGQDSGSNLACYMPYTLNISDTAGPVASGSCGENVSWELDGQGCLTITGSGAMGYYGADSLPWNDHLTDISRVVIGDGVTAISALAFNGCENLSEVTLPGSISSIGGGAFQGAAIRHIEIPEGVTRIADGMFQQCRQLESVVIPASVTEISGSPFYNCAALTKVYFNGTAAQWQAVNITNMNEQWDKLKNATLIFDGERFPITNGTSDGQPQDIAFTVQTPAGDNSEKPGTQRTENPYS